MKKEDILAKIGKFVRLLSMVMAICLMTMTSTVFAATTDTALSDYEQAVADLSAEYGVTITVKPIAAERAVELTATEKSIRLEELETRLIAGQKALQENNKRADENYSTLVDSGRIKGDDDTRLNLGATRATHTVYYYQQIGYFYPSASTIQCHITANMSYSDFHQRNLWGSVVGTGSYLAFGSADEWEETDCETQRIDGGRTYYVQVWGDLTEVYNDGFFEHEILSEGWRIWYEAYCPA